MINVIFNSVEFLLGFLPVFLVLYCATPAKYRNITLLVGSILFYAFGEPVYVFLLAGSVFLNYWVGRRLVTEKTTTKKSEKKRRLLYGAMAAADVLVLCFFKWIPQTGFMAGVTGLPLGISFYTFQILSYLTDVYRGEIPPERSFVRLSTYIVMFPQLVAGPIVNYSEVSDDLKERRMSFENVDQGLKLFVAGMALKVLLADRLSLLWNQIRTVGVQSISTPYAWMGAVGYSLQLYFDFYGYSLMAVGLGCLAFPCRKTLTCRTWQRVSGSFTEDGILHWEDGFRNMSTFLWVAAGRERSGRFSICSWYGCSPLPGTGAGCISLRGA